MHILLKRIDINSTNKAKYEHLFSMLFLKKHVVYSKIESEFIKKNLNETCSLRNEQLKKAFVTSYPQVCFEKMWYVTLDTDEEQEVRICGKNIIVNNVDYLMSDLRIYAEDINDIDFIEKIESITLNRFTVDEAYKNHLGGCSQLKNMVERLKEEKVIQYYILDRDVLKDKTIEDYYSDLSSEDHQLIHILPCYEIENAIPLTFYKNNKGIKQKKEEDFKKLEQLLAVDLEKFASTDITGIVRKLNKMKDHLDELKKCKIDSTVNFTEHVRDDMNELLAINKFDQY